MKLTSEQRAVVLSNSPRILINAGPGTGKTTTLACCAVRAARDLLRPGQRVAVVTLTNYAAGQMWGRIRDLGESRTLTSLISPVTLEGDRFDCGTFHSWAMRCAHLFGQSPGQVVHPTRELEIWKDVIKRVRPDWIKDPDRLDHLVSLNALYKTSGKSLATLVKRKHPYLSADFPAVKGIIGRVRKEMRLEGLVTFEDLLTRFERLLSSPQNLQTLVAKYPFLLIDEFQDTTRIQWKILKKLLPTQMSIIAAGDDSQTVYVWAGASFRRFQHFRKGARNVQEFTLTRNLRCTRKIVAVANALIQQSRFATPKAATSPTKGKKPVIVYRESHHELHDEIIRQIRWYHEENGTYEGLLVTYRFYVEASYLMHALDAARIPYRVFGDRSRRDRPIVNLIFALIHIVEKDSKEEKDWKPVITSVGGIGEAKWKHVFEWLKNGDRDCPVNNDSLQGLLGTISGLQTGRFSKKEKFHTIVNMARAFMREPPKFRTHILPTLTWFCYGKTFLQLIEQKYQDLSYPLLYPQTDSPPYPESYVTLSNVHRIKGGGYKSVLYLGADEEIFKKYKLFKKKRSLEGELQLMNVVVTRAEEELVLFFNATKSDFANLRKTQTPIRFFNSIDRGLFELK